MYKILIASGFAFSLMASANDALEPAPERVIDPGIKKHKTGRELYNFENGGDGVSGQKLGDRMMGIEQVGSKESIRTVIVKPVDEMVTPGDMLKRYNETPRTGAGTLQEESPLAANCVPHSVKTRALASGPAFKGFLCTRIHRASGFAKAGLENDDVIISVDGKKIGNAKKPATLLQKIELADYSQIVIVRDGREEILAPPLR